MVSPFQAIRDYEITNNIPRNWVNFAISRSGTQGAWQRLERGEIQLTEDQFFHPFQTDLHNERVWDEYWDVYIRKLELKPGSTSALPRRTTMHPPEMDTTALFWSMMAVARDPDPIMYPTLRYLRAEYPSLILAALSNTVPFPPEHPYSHPTSLDRDPRSWFDVFVSSSEVGLRKPSKDIYELAVRRLGAFVSEKGAEAIRPQEIVFLDDIGENCKMGTEVGLQVIKVELGRTEDAVGELGRRVFGVEDLVARVKAWGNTGSTSRL